MRRLLIVAAAVAVTALPAVLAAGEPLLEVALAHPVLRAGAARTSYLEVALTGRGSVLLRPPVNLGLVLDRSESMTGDRVAAVRAAAASVVRLLDEGDVVSVVAYDGTVTVLVPATRLTEGDTERIIARLDALAAARGTALFAGVSKGAAELRKYASPERVNRILLVSDGLANIGPSTATELARLGASLAEEGIAVSTVGLGLGYHEDLMKALAGVGDAHHYFVADAAELTRAFRAELASLRTVVAQDVLVRVELAPGVRPVRVLGRDADVTGRVLTVSLNQLYSGRESHFVVEVETGGLDVAGERAVARVAVEHMSLLTGTRVKLAGEAVVTVIAPDQVAPDPELVPEQVDRAVMVTAAVLLANHTSKRAVALRDRGRIDEARELLLANAEFLRQYAAAYDAGELQSSIIGNVAAANSLDEASWAVTRKELRVQQHCADQQQLEQFQLVQAPDR